MQVTQETTGTHCAQRAESRGSDWDASGRTNLDGVRFLAAAAVLFYHCYPLLYGPETGATALHRDPLFSLSGGAFSTGGTAVLAFFVLSGFLISRSWGSSRGLVDFAVRRIRRIYPAYIAASLVGWLVVGWFGAPDRGEYYRSLPWLQLPLQVLFLRTIDIPGAHIWPASHFQTLNGSSWTVAFEMGCYAIVAALGLLGALTAPRRRWIVPALLACALAVNHYFSGAVVPPAALRGSGFVPSAWPALPAIWELAWIPYLAPFLAGSTLYLYRDRIPRSGLLAIASVIVLSVTAAGHAQPGAMNDVLPASAVCGSYLVLYVAFARRPLLEDWKVWTRGADLSYGLYLAAWPVQQAIILIIGRNHLSPILLFCLAFPVSCAVAAVSWRLIEEPFLRKRERTKSPISAWSGACSPAR